MSQSIAFVFPGQGSQAVGMLADFADSSIVKQTFDQASAALGYDLWTLVSQGPESSLGETHRTQPALLAASTALWRLWCDNHTKPAFVAGHSLGEYSALVAADAIDFATAVKLVEQRGQFMQQAVPSGVGKMAAVLGLDNDVIIAACLQAAGEQIVSAVNFNSPGQVVIAGHAEAVERAMEACKEKGAKRVLPLSVSVPSHCALMKPAAEQLAKVLEQVEIASPTIALVNNVDVAVVSEPNAIKEALVRQLYCPVRWTESVEYLVKQGVTQLVECGPGAVLSGLSKRIDRSLTAFSLATNNGFSQAAEAMKAHQ